MVLREALKEINNNLENIISQSVKKEDIKVLKNYKKILLIKSANNSIFIEFLNKVFNINPHLFIIFLLRKDEEDILINCKNPNESLFIEDEGIILLSNIMDVMEEIRKLEIENGIMLWNNNNGDGYENIHEIFTELGLNSYFSFNCRGEFQRVSIDKLTTKSVQLQDALQSWFWEYIKIRGD